jgi:hypothetical protein
MSIPPGSRTASPANADDIRVDSIAAQLEEAEQKRLTDYRIEGQRAREPMTDRTSARPETTMGRFQQGVAQ